MVGFVDKVLPKTMRLASASAGIFFSCFLFFLGGSKFLVRIICMTVNWPEFFSRSYY